MTDRTDEPADLTDNALNAVVGGAGNFKAVDGLSAEVAPMAAMPGLSKVSPLKPKIKE